MNGDFSRISFEKKKHYEAVLMQQGRVLTDADWNEAQAIHAYLRHNGMTDVVGWSGVPKVGGGFQIGVTGGGQQLTVSPGHLYAGGILCENDSANVVTPIKPSANGRYLVYLDVWQRHVTAIEDAHIREAALGGADTTTRLQTFWQIRISPNPVANCDAMDAVTPPVPKPSGMMKAYHDPVSTSSNLCALPATGGFLGLENQLYRVEIHRSGERDNASNRATFKWSRENGSVVTYVTSTASPVVTVQDFGHDEVLGFANDHWVELIDIPMELNIGRGELLQIDKIDPSKHEITMKTSLPALDASQPIRLRRWDQSGSAATGNGIALGAGPIELENGIKIEFSAGTYRAGDYWMFAARTALNPGASPAEGGTLEWPKDNSNQAMLIEPRGIEHQYSPLALLDYNSTTQQFSFVSDCRRMFPALTEITASDVSFNNVTCNFPGVTTVQEAIDFLCQRTSTACTLEVLPGQDLAAAFASLADGEDAEICLQVGTYALTTPAVLSNKGHILLHGAGAGTRVVAVESETALRFENCKDVVVENMALISGRAGPGPEAGFDSLNGTLTFRDCASVLVKNVDVTCADAFFRSTACLTIINQTPPAGPIAPGSARIYGCDLTIGFQQVGILLVNVPRAQVEDNTLNVAPLPDSFSYESLLASAYRKPFMKLLRRRLFSNIHTGSNPPANVTTNVTLNISNNPPVHFYSPFMDQTSWDKLVQAAGPVLSHLELDVVKGLKTLAELIIVRDPTLFAALPVSFRQFWTIISNLLRQWHRPAASQGITIAGQAAKDVRILNNTIEGCMQGIHVGFGPQPAEAAGNVLLSGNTVNVPVPVYANRDRHAIFIGNCDSLSVENNSLTCLLPTNSRLPANSMGIRLYKNSLEIDGIRLYGQMGRRMLVRQNHITQFTNGVYAYPLFDVDESLPASLWLIADNVTPSDLTNSVAVKVDPVIQKYEQDNATLVIRRTPNYK